MKTPFYLISAESEWNTEETNAGATENLESRLIGQPSAGIVNSQPQSSARIVDHTPY